MGFFDKASSKPSERRQRVALLNAELDVQRETATERARSIQVKASFLVVVAGLLAGTAFDTPKGFEHWWLSTLPLVMALGTVVAATIALWPAPAGAIDPEKVWSKWIDSTHGAYSLEIYLLKLKVVAYNEMQLRTNARVTALKVGFVLLSIAIAIALLVFIMQRVN